MKHLLRMKFQLQETPTLRSKMFTQSVQSADNEDSDSDSNYGDNGSGDDDDHHLIPAHGDLRTDLHLTKHVLMKKITSRSKF